MTLLKCVEVGVPLPWLASPIVWGMEFRFLCQNKALPDLLSFCSASTHPMDALHSCHFQTTTVLHEVLFCVCICVSVLFAWNSPHLLWGLRNCSSFTWGTVVSLPKFSLNVTFSLTQVKSVAPLYACQSPDHPLQCHHLLMCLSSSLPGWCPLHLCISGAQVYGWHTVRG